MTMSIAEEARFVTIDRRRPLDALVRHEPVFGALGLLMMAAMAPTLFAYAIDGRTFNSVNIWLKPLKFEFSLTLYFLTLAFFGRWLPAGIRARRWYRWFAGAVVVASVAEIVWIGAAAAMGTASHFNTTPIGAAIYPAMGVAATLITSASAVFAWQIWRNGALRMPPAFRESVVLGLALVLPLTLITAGTMSGLGGHGIGGQAGDTGGLMLMGWARDGGDLRVAHFFATHAMHFIPAFALVSVAVFGGADRRPVRIFAALFVAFVAFTFLQALMGRPFLAAVG